MSLPIISVENLSKRYTLRHQKAGYTTLRDALAEKAQRLFGHKDSGSDAANEEFWALKDVSFEINRGDVVGIIGRNGAGKSTLLKILSRITEPTAGRICLGGRVASLLEVGTGFHPELTGRENIFLNGAILGMTKAEIRSKFDEIVAFAEVEKFLDTPVKHYSSGMYVRLAFAVAAHLEPEILIVDEVLAVGDAQFQNKCLDKMQSVSGQGRTVLFVSHNMPVVQQLTRSAIMLQNGRICAVGNSADVIAEYTRRSAHGSAVEQDVSHTPRKFSGLSETVRIERLAFVSKSSNIFEADEPITIALWVRSRGPATVFRISLTISRIDGSPVGSAFSGDVYAIDAGNTARVATRLHSLRLAEGDYIFAIAIGKGDHTTGHTDYDIVSNVLPFQVMAERGVGAAKAIWTPSWGAIRFPRLEKVIEPDNA